MVTYLERQIVTYVERKWLRILREKSVLGISSRERYRERLPDKRRLQELQSFGASGILRICECVHILIITFSPYFCQNYYKPLSLIVLITGPVETSFR
jgi:hypothetical protein